MKRKIKLGKILCEKKNLEKPPNQRNYFVVIQEETEDRYLVIQPINTNTKYISGTSINPFYPEQDLTETKLKASYLINQEITVMESNFKEPVTSVAIAFEGQDRLIEFTAINSDLIGNVYFEINSPKNTTMSGFLFYDFHHKEKFNK